MDEACMRGHAGCILPLRVRLNSDIMHLYPVVAQLGRYPGKALRRTQSRRNTTRSWRRRCLLLLRSYAKGIPVCALAQLTSVYQISSLAVDTVGPIGGCCNSGYHIDTS